MKTKITLPLAKILNNEPLSLIANDLNLVTNAIKESVGDDSIYYEDNQSKLEAVLTHTNIMTIIAHGGEIENYLMYAKIPVIVEVLTVPTSIYTIQVPVGLQKRTMRISDGTQIIPEVVKTLGQWCNNQITQKFSSDYQYTYIETGAPGWWLSGSELAVFVDGFSAQLVTLKEYNILLPDLL